MPPAVRMAFTGLKRWLLEDAYPLWWERGADRANGGWFDGLTLDGTPVVGPKRLRVQARQAHVFALAPSLGWTGPAEEACNHGLWFIVNHCQRRDGLYRSNVDAAGAPIDEVAEVYDQAFVILALASHEAAFRGGADMATLLEGSLLDYHHRLGGCMEAPGQAEPLLANPNMHLFESYLAWMPLTVDRIWSALAAGQAKLALTRLIDPATGAISETYGADWRPVEPPAARVVWPGHLFEWAWLLLRWPDGDTASRAAALQLIEVGERAGVDRQRGVAMFALDGALAPTDRRARLWAQTERIKALALAAELTGDEGLWAGALQGCESLGKFLEVPTRGLWRDWMDEGGGFAIEPAPASSFYHIVGAIAELERLTQGAAE